jgi:hypothetical protein
MGISVCGKKFFINFSSILKKPVWEENTSNFFINVSSIFHQSYFNFKSLFRITLILCFLHNFIMTTTSNIGDMPTTTTSRGGFIRKFNWTEDLLFILAKEVHYARAYKHTKNTAMKGKWEMVRLGDLISSDIVYAQRGKTITKKTIESGNIPVIAGGQSSPYSHNKSTHEGNIITVSASLATFGIMIIQFGLQIVVYFIQKTRHKY